MASPSAANATQQTGNYAPGSLAAQPTRHAGGVRGRNEDPAQFRARMDGGAMAHGQMPRGLTMPPMAQMPGGQTRQDRIIAARMDGTFDTKRNQFNTANAGKLVMDEAGNIAPGTTSAPAAVNLVPAANPVSAPTAPPASPPIAKLPAPAQMAANVAAGAAGGPVAAAMSQVAEAGASKAAADLKKIQDRNFSRHRVALERLHGPMSAAVSARSRERQRQDGDLNTLNPDAAKILQQPAPASPSSSTGLRPPITRTAGGELVQPGTPMNPNARWSKPASPSAANATQQTGNYAPGSLAASPRRHAGGVRRRDESP